jgi:hypothetical protein
MWRRAPAPPDEAVGFGIVLRAIEAHGTLNVPLPSGPPFFRFSDPQECVRVLHEAGFAAPHVTSVPQTWRLPSPDALFEVMQRSTVRTAGLLRRQPAGVGPAICAAIAKETVRYSNGNAIELPMPAVLASATVL